MQGNGDYVADPSQVSGSGQGDSPSVLLHSSKLRNKLEKLAQWRINSSLIEFPQHAREFHGGFATVSKGLLGSSSRAGGTANESEQITDDHRSSKDGNPLSDTQKPGDRDQGEDEEADGRMGKGDNDQTKVEGRQDHDEDQKPHDQTSIQEISCGPASSEQAVNGDPALDDRTSQPQSNTQEPNGNRQGKDTGTDSGIAAGDNDQENEAARSDPDKTENREHTNHQTPQPKVVAVKKLKIEGDTDLKRALGLALKESELLVGLSHPNIVRLEGFVEELSEHKVWLIFPWEEHGNLRDFLASGEWEIPERIALIHDVTLGLEYLHSREPPIYHGDLKSLNILVNLKCNAVITDFGSARHLGGDHVGKRPKANEDKTQPSTDTTTTGEHITLEAFFSATASTLTLTGSSYTLRWAAPELLQDESPRLPSDIWALGWIAYEVMTNTIPFHDIKKDAIVINRVIQGHLPSVTQDARMSLIRALCSLMVQCWSINPDKRPTVEECRKLISWMPRITPAPVQAIDEKASQLRHAQLQNQLGSMYRRQADFICALNCFKESLEIYTNHNDRRGRADTLCCLADVHRFRNELTEALTLHSEALDIYTDLGLLWGRATAMFGLAETHRFRREFGEAARLYAECQQIYTDFAIDQRGKATAICGLAEVHRVQREYNEAVKLYSEAMQIYTDVGDWREKAVTLHGLAEVYLYQHKYSEATNLYSEALRIFTDFGDHKQRANTLHSLAEVHWSQQAYGEARRLYSESLQVSADIGDKHGKGIALWGLAEVHRVRQEYNEASKLYSEVIQIFTDLEDKYWMAEVLASVAVANQMQGQLSSAISLYTEASENFREIGDSMRASYVLRKAEDIRKALAEATADPAETVEVGEGPFLTSG